MILTGDELVELTHMHRPSAQRRALTTMGIPYRVRPDGTIVVFRDQFANAPTPDRSPSPRLRLS